MAVEVSKLGLNCHNCHENPDLQRARGCLAPTEHPQHVMRDGTKIYRCPSKIIRPDIRYYIELYSYYKNGILPFRGSVQEQPSKIMNIFNILEVAEKEVAEDKQKFVEGMIRHGSNAKK